MPFEVADCGILKNVPGWGYRAHKDVSRLAAVNIQMFDDSDDYQVFSYTDDFTEKIKIPYYKNKPILLNTTKFHSIYNASKTTTRYLLTIGCPTESYEVIKERFKNYDKISSI
jgi:hypothetical protein